MGIMVNFIIFTATVRNVLYRPEYYKPSGLHPISIYRISPFKQHLLVPMKPTTTKRHTCQLFLCDCNACLVYAAVHNFTDTSEWNYNIHISVHLKFDPKLWQIVS
jgi:hypothetical protein